MKLVKTLTEASVIVLTMASVSCTLSPPALPTATSSRPSPSPHAERALMTPTPNPDCPFNLPNDPSWYCREPTPLPTRTPLASLTPAPVPTKGAFIVYNTMGGGDGGFSLFDYLRSTSSEPDIVIYTDGQMLSRSEGGFDEAQLSFAQMCSLRDTLENQMTDRGSIYNGTPTPEAGFGNGEPGSHLAISSDPYPLTLSYSFYEIPLLTTKAMRPFSFIQAFATQQASMPYIPRYFAVWLEVLYRPAEQSPEDSRQVYFPPLSYYDPTLLTRLLAGREQGLVLFEPQSQVGVSVHVGPQPSVEVFNEEGIDYLAVFRPLLPHQSIEMIAQRDVFFPEPVAPGALPFSCP